MKTTRVNKHIPPMSAQDYHYIADVIASLSDRPSKKTIIERFAQALEPTNPNFRREFFEEACNRVPDNN